MVKYIPLSLSTPFTLLEWISISSLLLLRHRRRPTFVHDTHRVLNMIVPKFLFWARIIESPHHKRKKKMEERKETMGEMRELKEKERGKRSFLVDPRNVSIHIFFHESHLFNSYHPTNIFLSYYHWEKKKLSQQLMSFSCPYISFPSQYTHILIDPYHHTLIPSYTHILHLLFPYSSIFSMPHWRHFSFLWLTENREAIFGSGKRNVGGSIYRKHWIHLQDYN